MLSTRMLVLFCNDIMYCGKSPGPHLHQHQSRLPPLWRSEGSGEGSGLVVRFHTPTSLSRAVLGPERALRYSAACIEVRVENYQSITPYIIFCQGRNLRTLPNPFFSTSPETGVLAIPPTSLQRVPDSLKQRQVEAMTG